jgi:hypothetical protein
MNIQKVLLPILVGFCLPLLVVVVLYREDIGKRFEIDPRTHQGRLLYFTVPGAG